jgi:hypothetical protein
LRAHAGPDAEKGSWLGGGFEPGARRTADGSCLGGARDRFAKVAGQATRRSGSDLTERRRRPETTFEGVGHCDSCHSDGPPSFVASKIGRLSAAVEAVKERGSPRRRLRPRVAPRPQVDAAAACVAAAASTSRSRRACAVRVGAVPRVGCRAVAVGRGAEVGRFPRLASRQIPPQGVQRIALPSPLRGGVGGGGANLRALS